MKGITINQLAAMNKVFRDKTKYNRKREKHGMRLCLVP